MSRRPDTPRGAYSGTVSSVPTASPDIGVLLDGRYRVEELVARGGMASVHRGHDERLDRTVALKIMHPHLAGDPEFLARFLREAKAAARLSHPHVVPVYDQGEDQGRVYLAMELIEGETVRELLRREGALTVRDALRIAIPVAQALRAAHAAGIAHRDIKPENILLADDGRVKVADFGLARAIGAAHSSATGTLLGTVAYVPPEVVTRGASDERSDLYSFGVVLFEMLTGSQPYTGDQPVHIAFQHAHEDMPAPSLTAPSVPRELDSLVTWCCARTPSSRPRDARELLRALEELGQTLPASVLDAAPVLVVEHDTQDVPRLTSDIDPAALGGDAPARSFEPSGPIASVAPARDAAHGADRADVDEPRVLAVRPPRERRARHLAGRAPRRSRGLAATALLAVLALLAGAGWTGWTWYGTQGPGADRIVPAVVGEPLADAEAALDGQDLRVRTEETFSETVPAGGVVAATPSAGTEVKRGDAVVLLVSRGVQTFPVPDVQGRTADEARAAIEAQGLAYVEDEHRYDPVVPEGSVVSQSADAAALPAGGEVHVVISRGVEPVAVPDQTGRPEAEATAALSGQGFVVRTSQAYSGSVPAGSVVSQDPAGGTAPPGSAVRLVISRGPEMVAVPDVFRLPEAEARAALEGAGLSVEVVHDRGTPVFGLVYEQSVAGGTQAPKGSTVTIRVF